MPSTQRIVSFLLAFFLLASSVAAVFLVVKQTNDQQALDQSIADQQASAARCVVADNLKSVPPSSPGEIQKLDAKVNELQKVTLREGSGDTVALNDCITVNYRLSLADGTIVAGNDTFTTGSPIAFELKEGSLIQGWTQGIPGTKVGGILRLIVPASLGYGDQGSCRTADAADPTKCAEYSIPPAADLVFDIEVLDTKR